MVAHRSPKPPVRVRILLPLPLLYSKRVKSFGMEIPKLLFFSNIFLSKGELYHDDKF